MTLFQTWTDMLSDGSQSNDFWQTYLAVETNIYKEILSDKNPIIDSTVKKFGEKYGLTPLLAIGFLDGINESLKESLDLTDFKEDSEFSIEIDFKKLYKNMLKVKAKWLSSLPEWENVYSKDELKAIKTEYLESVTAKSDKVGRNDPCTCGSGKKYKKCCGA